MWTGCLATNKQLLHDWNKNRTSFRRLLDTGTKLKHRARTMAFVVPNAIAAVGNRRSSSITRTAVPFGEEASAIPRYCRPATVPTVKRRRSCTKALLIDFAPSDFEIQRIVGQQAFATITDWEYYGGKDPLAPTRTVQPSEPAIRLYEARISSSFPRLYNARVVLKEFLKGGVELGVNEAESYKILYEADGSGIDPDVVPVATLLGTFLTDESFERPGFAATWARRFPNSPNPPTAGAPFLVFRWEGMQTGLNCAAPKDSGADPGTRLLDKWFPRNLAQRRTVFIRTFMRRALDALYYLHSTGGMVHRSMGLASIMVNTSEYRLASSLLVKIRDLGFAKPISALATGDGLEKARKAGAVTPGEIGSFYYADDIYALGYAFLVLIFSAYGGTPVTQDRFKVLFEDTFDLNVTNFRQYCAADPDWTEAVDLLDEDDGAGWDLVKAMLGSREDFKSTSVEDLREYKFFSGDK